MAKNKERANTYSLVFSTLQLAMSSWGFSFEVNILLRWCIMSGRVLCAAKIPLADYLTGQAHLCKFQQYCFPLNQTIHVIPLMSGIEG